MAGSAQILFGYHWLPGNNWHLPAMDGAGQGVRAPPRCEWVHVRGGCVSVIEKIKKKHNHNKHDMQIKQLHLKQATNCTATRFALIRGGSISIRKNHVWMRIGVSS